MHLRHERHGSGPPLLLIHGVGMSHHAYDEVVPLLADDFECFAIDLPGFGESPRMDEPASMAGFARACHAFMAAQGHDAYHVAGNSLGGGIALFLGLSGKALSACGLSPAGFAAGPDLAYLHGSLAFLRAGVPLLAALPEGAWSSPLVRKAALAQYALHGERRTPAQVAEGFGELKSATAFGETQRRALMWKCPLTLSPPCPLTVAWGAKDRLLLTGPQAARAKRRLPTARHVLLEGCGHLPTWDDPAQVARVVREAAQAPAEAGSPVAAQSR